MFDIEIEQTPTTEQLLSWIDTVEQEVLGDLREFWRDAATAVLVEEITRIFASNGYGQWQPLSPAYAARKARTHPAKTILRREDNYFRSAVDRRQSGNIAEYRPDEMEFGVDLAWFQSRFGYPYPLAHEQGRGNLPARPVWELLAENPDVQNKLVAALSAFVQKRIEDEAKRVF